MNKHGLMAGVLAALQNRQRRTELAETARLEDMKDLITDV
jgi:hypothetical protein